MEFTATLSHIHSTSHVKKYSIFLFELTFSVSVTKFNGIESSSSTIDKKSVNGTGGILYTIECLNANIYISSVVLEGLSVPLNA